MGLEVFIIFDRGWSKLILFLFIVLSWVFNWCSRILLKELCCLLSNRVFPFWQIVVWNSHLLYFYIVHQLTKVAKVTPGWRSLQFLYIIDWNNMLLRGSSFTTMAVFSSPVASISSPWICQSVHQSDMLQSVVQSTDDSVTFRHGRPNMPFEWWTVIGLWWVVLQLYSAKCDLPPKH